MKKFLIPFVLALSVGGLAYGQSITKSLQGSQDPRGPVGLDASNNAYFPGHILDYTGSSFQPTIVGAVASGTVTDVAGIVSTSTTTMTITFGQAFNQPPACILQELAGTTVPTFTTRTNQISATTVVGGQQYAYLCFSYD